MRHGWIVGRALLLLSTGLLVVGGDSRAEDWTLPDNRLGIRTAPILLLTRPEVQADLRLEPAQIAGAQSTISDLTRRGMALRGKTGAAVVAERRAIDEVQSQWLSTNLSGKQLDRLNQIDLQWEGAAAMISRPTVVEYLKLTDDQCKSMRGNVSELYSKRSQGHSSPADEQVLRGKTSTVLTPTQKQLWLNLVGAPCRFGPTIPAGKSLDPSTQPAGFNQPRR